ncbi:PAS domain S-box protein [Geomonas sp.]|uniref:PAS domain-containing sensor histidine kinase n=1 Tax=Geomonas sp. TaxID=2651584 RepID=UPI002B494A38|nr:PAS domain S-box protein [Geomonas sp.]HJV36453.1 PAS domain S-box protein [Geomonas sp.]
MAQPSQELDYRRLFDSVPDPCLVLDPALHILAVNDAYLRATGTVRERMLGRYVFEVFPENPADPGADGLQTAKGSMERALRERVTDVLGVQKYDIPRTEAKGGGFEERYWTIINTPVLDAGGEVLFIIHRVQDVTEFVRMSGGEREGRGAPVVAESGDPAQQATGIDHQLEQAKAQLESKNARLLELNLRLKEEADSRVRAQEAQRVSEERLRFAMEAADIGAWHWDILHDKVTWTDRCKNLFGFPADFPMSYRAYLERIHPEDRDAIDAAVHQSLRQQLPLLVEMRVQLPGGRMRWVMSKGRGIYNEEGEPVQMHGVALDITERKQAEEAVRSSERRFARIFHAAPALLVLSSLREGRILDANEAALTALGYARGEFVGRLVQEIDLWEDEEDRRKIVNALRQRGSVSNLEITLRAKSGERHPALYSGEVLEIEGTGCILSLVRDISERKKAEQALQRAKDEWERTFNTVPDLIAIVDVNNRIVRVNRAMSEKLGCGPDGCTGIPCHAAFEAGDRAALTCPHAAAMAEGREQVAEIQEPSGRHYLVSYTPLLSPDGTPLGVVHVARDITERKLAEQEIAQLNADLAARASELEAANRELEAFNYTVAHDLRQPLNSINGYCQAIEMICGEQLGAECQGYLQEICKAVVRMSRLINALLDLARMGRVALCRSAVDLSVLAEVAIDELRKGEPEREVEVVIGEGLTAEADPELVRIVLDNLLGNAWKYTRGQAGPLIEFGLRQVGGEAAFFVSDNGAGFEMADAGRLFSPFQRLPTAERQSGFGIGLATVERIVRRHGGRVWAEGEPGRGATFYFTLPPDSSLDQRA